MSAIRDKAKIILDGVLPGTTEIRSDRSEKKYKDLTGLSHKTLTDNWAAGGSQTGCNGFTGWYGNQLGGKDLAVFDLQGAAKKAGKPGAWVVSTSSNRPKYGDILRHASYHVDVCLGFDGDVLLRAAGGQGGKNAGCDIIKRVRGASAYDPKKLQGWLDIDVYFGAAAAPDAELEWLHGWWTVSDGNLYYYYFYPTGSVQYTKTRPAAKAPPPVAPLNRGSYSYSKPGNLVIDWNALDGGATRETFRDAFPSATKMHATSNRYAPLVATRIV